MRQPFKRMLVVSTAALALTLGGSSVALAATTGSDGSSVVATSSTTTVLGPLGLFDNLTDGFFSFGSAGATTTASQATVSQAEEDAITQLVRGKMASSDQIVLDQWLANQKQQQAVVDGAQSQLSSTDEELNALVDKYLGLQTTSGSTATTTAGTKLLSTVFKVSADWVFPVQGPHSFSDTFSAPRYAGGYHTHKGTDIMCARNTPIVAVVSGVIRRTNPLDTGLGGISVYLKGDDGNSYYYAHLTSIQTGIKASVRATAGQVIGYAGNTGDAAGGPVHLHFEIHPGGGAAVDPYLVLKGAAEISDIVAATSTTTTSTTTTMTSTTTTTAMPTSTTNTSSTNDVPNETSGTQTTIAAPGSTTVNPESTTTTAGSSAMDTAEPSTTTTVPSDSTTTTGGVTTTGSSTTVSEPKSPANHR